MIPLVIGTLLAVGALAYVLFPLFVDHAAPLNAVRPGKADADSESPIVALREIEFDRATGKLSDADYAELKARYTRDALDAMRREQRTGTETDLAVEDEVEAAVARYRSQRAGCPECGPRPEHDAAYCSNCGRYLHDRCADCGAPVEAHDARYCVNCGNPLAA